MVFKIVVEKDETGYYVAEVPALPGCVSQGRTIEEVKKNIKEAIEGWLEVMNDKVKKTDAQTFEVAV
ncbi:hypothetical protein ES702_04595 [subsurface metagenome]